MKDITGKKMRKQFQRQWMGSPRIGMNIIEIIPHVSTSS